VQVRWYGLFFALGIVLTYLVVRWVFNREKYSVEHLDSIAVWLFVGLVVGARLGHVFFYRAEYFLSNPVEILKIWEGGLASHGAAIGLIAAFWLWNKVHKVKFSKYVNAFMVGVPITAAFVRLGNFFNSEIVGVETNGDWGVVFTRLGDSVPRHPAQLYEMLVLIFTGLVLWGVYRKWGSKLPDMMLMFMFFVLYFGGRFFTEFFKDLHGPLTNIPLAMGQLLSLVFVTAGIIYFAWLGLAGKRKL